MTSILEQAKELLQITEEDLKQEVIVKRKENVCFLLLNRKNNTLNQQFIISIHKKLDQIQAIEDQVSLVTISLSKHFSAGIDVKSISNLHPEAWRYFLLRLIALLGRIAVFPMPTLTLVEGYAIGGGLMLAFAHDRLYTTGKTVFNLPQVNLGLNLIPGMNAIVKKKINSHQLYRDMCLLGKKVTEKDALNKISDGHFESKSVQEIFNLAQNMSKYGQNKSNYKKLKQQMYKNIIDCCFNKQIDVGVRGQWDLPKIQAKL